MKFKKYQHVHRLGKPATNGILKGRVYLFPKIDGANASVFLKEDGTVGVGKRRGEVKEDTTLKGLKRYIDNHKGIKDFLASYPHLRLYGEWLIKNAIKGYRDDAWKQFYVFDVVDESDPDVPEGQEVYLTYDEYQPLLEKHDIKSVPLLKRFIDPTKEDILNIEPERYNFLIEEGSGEGLVIKNYDFINRFGERVWAKVIDTDFNNGTQQKPKRFVDYTNETDLVDKNMGKQFVEKEFLKFKDENAGFEKRDIGKMLNKIYDVFIYEEGYNLLKEASVIDTEKLQKVVFFKIKELLPDVFQ